MRYAINRAKETVITAFDKDGPKYKAAFEIIDRRWKASYIDHCMLLDTISIQSISMFIPTFKGMKRL